jgi:hypothetical protein
VLSPDLYSKGMDNLIAWQDKCFNRLGNYVEDYTVEIYTSIAMSYHNFLIKGLLRQNSVALLFTSLNTLSFTVLMG